jgi:type II secretory pathway pseudopilin PulG
MTFLAPETLIVVAIVLPLLAAVIIPVFGSQPDRREAVTLAAAAA